MRVRLGIAITALGLAACGGTEPPQLGPAESHIISGQDQVVTAKNPTAADARLPDPVVNQIVRSHVTGKLRMRRVPAWEKLILPELAWAQTVVNGSPVPGAVVCAQEGVELAPFSRCTNTDNNGKATFHFKHGSKAGIHKAEIRGTLQGEPAVFDTVKATVLADIPDSLWVQDNTAPRTSPAAYLTTHVVDRFDNPSPYRLTSDARITVQDTVLGSLGARTITFSAMDSTWKTVPITGRTGAIGQFTYRIVSESGTLRAQAVFCGLKVSPCKSTEWVP